MSSCVNFSFLRDLFTHLFQQNCQPFSSSYIFTSPHRHHHHVRLLKTMTKRIEKIDLKKTANESIGPFKKDAGNKIAVINHKNTIY